jgi:hypothetical protein
MSNCAKTGNVLPTVCPVPAGLLGPPLDILAEYDLLQGQQLHALALLGGVRQLHTLHRSGFS